MLNTLLSVIRAILVELVDQLLRKVCTLGGKLIPGKMSWGSSWLPPLLSYVRSSTK